jgi:hypothetical protein
LPAADSADGQTFLMLKVGEGDARGLLQQIVVVEHFDEELKTPPAAQVVLRGFDTAS